MTLIKNFFNLVIPYISFKTPFIYFFTSIKRFFNIFFIYKKTFCKSFHNSLKVIFNIIYNLRNFLKTWSFTCLFFFLVIFNYLIFSIFIIKQIFLLFTSYFSFFWPWISIFQIFDKCNCAFISYIYYNFVINYSNKLNLVE